jgi:tetratricopeptide (TPR) repeat protein
VHDGATSAERRAAHGALATALADVDPASSTWHRASAVLPPDEGLAARLADLAGGAVRRADPGLAAVAFRRAADFTGDPRARLCWLLAAGQAAWDAGRVTEARSLVAAAGAAATADEDVARVQELRGRLEALTGSAARGFETLLPAAESVLAAAPDRAARMLYTALQAASVAGDMRRVEQAGRVAGRLAGGADPEPVAVVAAALADLVTKQRVRDGIALAEATRALARTDDLDGLTTAAVAAVFSGDYPLGEELASRAVARCRDVGAVGTLARALEPLVVARLSRAPRQAEADADEGLCAARETDQVASAATHLGSMAVVAALRGDRQRTEQLAGEALGLDRLHGVAYPAAMVQAALGLLELGLGRPTEALAHLEPLHEHEGHPAVRLLAADFTVLAAVWSGRPELAHAVLTTVGSWPWVRETASRAWAETTLNRWRGLLGDGAEATACFERAVAGEAATGQPLGLAVTHLLLGEHLRRSRQRAAARPHLRAALELFERLDACRGRPGRAPSSEPPVRACEVTATTSPV